MNNKQALSEYIDMANIQAERVEQTLTALQNKLPLTESSYQTLSLEESAYFDMLSTRFSKLQNIIGTKIFPNILTELGEDELPAFRDKANKLEKLGYLESVEWWFQLREARNEITHEYPGHISELVQAINTFSVHAKDLLAYWDKLQKQLENL